MRGRDHARGRQTCEVSPRLDRASLPANDNRFAIVSSYDSTGNILTKTGVGTYSYGSGAGPHALTSIATCSGCTVNGVANPAYTYDANGDMTAGAGRSVGYTSFNMAASISEGSASVALTYD